MNLKQIIKSLVAAIDKGTMAKADTGFRNHLGASVIGHECARHVWYHFRWAALDHPEPRMVRLWDRGNREEAVFETLLRDAGLTVSTSEEATGKQYRISDFGGLFGGSTDGVVWGFHLIDETWALGEVWGLVEFKTHNDKSFTKLVKEGVAKSKPRHVAQMQIYMAYRGLPFALYCAVNKDTDELYFEIVLYDQAQAVRWRMRADNAIHSVQPLPKISQSPAWYECKFCQFSDVCHKGALPLRNCRTCAHVVIDSVAGKWRCGKQGDKTLDRAAQEAACQSYTPNPLFNG